MARPAAATAPAARESHLTDEESNAIIYQGATMAQICQIFGMDARDVKPKINGHVTPCGKRKGREIYSIKEVAAYLCPPPYDIDEFVQRMSIADLPSILRKEFWAGLRSRQLYEKEAAELWPTSEVVDMVSALFKTIRMSLLLTRETVERETELTDRQRDIVLRVIDNALEDAHAKITSQFAKTKRNADSAEILTEQEVGSEDL